jgi:hypothetical protein
MTWHGGVMVALAALGCLNCGGSFSVGAPPSTLERGLEGAVTRSGDAASRASCSALASSFDAVDKGYTPKLLAGATRLTTPVLLPHAVVGQVHVRAGSCSLHTADDMDRALTALATKMGCDGLLAGAVRFVPVQEGATERWLSAACVVFPPAP